MFGALTRRIIIKSNTKNERMDLYNKILSRLLRLSLDFSATDPLVRRKVIFLNSVFFFAGTVALAMAFVRWHEYSVTGMVNLAFAGFCFTLIYLLNRYQRKVELFSSLALAISFLYFCSAYLNAPYNKVRLSLFMLLTASAFFLKGRRAGFFLTLLTLLTVISVYLLALVDTAYSPEDIITFSLYLIAFYFIVENYETLREDQNEHLRESESRFRSLFEELPDPVWIIKNHRFVEANAAAAHVLGYARRDEIQFFHPSEISPEFQPDGEPSYIKAERHMRTAEEKGIHRFEWIHTRRDGSLFPVEVTLSSINLHGESVLYCIWRDITERKRAEQSLLLGAERTRALLELTTRAPGMDDKDLLQFALSQVERLTGSSIAYVHDVDADQEVMRVGACTCDVVKSFGSPNDHHPIPRSGPWGECVGSGQPVIRNDCQTLPPDSGLPEGLAHLVRHLCVPVLHAGKVTMLMGVGDKASDYDESDLKELELIANSLWALRQRNHNMVMMELDAKVFQYSQEGIVITDTDNNIMSVNPAFTEITGYSQDEVAGKNPRLLKSDRHPAKVYQKLWNTLLRTGHWQGELWNQRKGGEMFLVWLSISIVRNEEGKITHHIGIMADITAHRAAEEKIHYLANFDPLTSLPNRTLLQDRAHSTLIAAARNRHHVALMYLGLDHFKNVNDSLGHDVGDLLLQEVARRLTELLREEDTVARTAGDQFVIVLPDADEKGTVHAAQRILESINRPFDIQNSELNISVSVGIAVFPENGKSFNELSRSADAALYRAKTSGRNTYQFFTEEMHARAHEILQVENDLHRATDRNELRLYFQPQVDVASGRIVGAEALVRWQHPKRGLVSPEAFIGIAEETGLIREIGDWVMRRAIEQNKAWQDAGLSIVPIAVNVSMAQFRQASLTEKVAALMNESGLQPRFLELELTESIAMEDSAYTTAVVDRLHRLGVSLAIDDFGTGYSSLSYLKRFRVHKLKIDKSFVQGLGHDNDDRAIVMTIISLARSLGFQTIAEGVETMEQFAFLREQDCDQVQGYLHSRPVPAEEFAKLLVDGKLQPQG